MISLVERLLKFLLLGMPLASCHTPASFFFHCQALNIGSYHDKADALPLIQRWAGLQVGIVEIYVCSQQHRWQYGL